MKKKKSKRMDPKLVAEKQVYELDTVARKFISCTRDDVRQVHAAVGRSREEVEAELKNRGFELKPKKGDKDPQNTPENGK